MQFRQGRHTGARITELHARADSGIEHPGGYDNDYARGDLNVDNLAAGALLSVLLSKTAAVERVPPVVDLHFWPDMRRMTCHLLLGEPTGSSPVAFVQASAPRPS